MIHEDTDRNVAALAELASGATPEQRAVIAAMQAREQAQWLDVLEILKSSPDAASGLASLRLRALGEVGRIGEMIRFYDSSKTAMASFDLQMAQLFLMAFTGRIAAVELMLSQQFSKMDVEIEGVLVGRGRSPFAGTYGGGARAIGAARARGQECANAPRGRTLSRHGAFRVAAAAIRRPSGACSTKHNPASFVPRDLQT